MNKILKKIAGFFIFMTIFGFSAFCQNPTYLIEIKNDTLLNARELTFDVFIKNTSSNPTWATQWELSGIQNGIKVNIGILNGGTITPTFEGTGLPSTTIANTYFQSSNIFMSGATTAYGIKITGRNVTQGVNTVMITTTPILLYKIKLTNNTADFTQGSTANLVSNLTGSFPWPSKLNAFTPTANTAITALSQYYSNSEIRNPKLNTLPLKFNLSGTGSYCLTGLPVTLSSSEIGVRYRLYKDNVAIDSSRIGTGNSIVWNNQTAGTYTVIANRIATYLTDTMIGSAVITISTGTIGSISSINGNNNVCQGQQNVLFNIPKVTNATNYKWEFSGLNSTFVSNVNDTFAIINFANNATNGTLIVKAYDACGDSVTSALFAINVNGLPESAGIISGSATASPLQSLVYTVPPINGATSYQWSYSGSDVNIVGNTNTVSLNFGTSTTSGILTVKGINSCGEGLISAGFTINVSSIPAPAGNISGLNSICPGQANVRYIVPEIPGADTYFWEYSGTGLTIDSTLGDTAYINFSSNATNGNLTVKGHNSFGYGSISQNYAIIINPLPIVAGVITGNINPCKNTTNNVYKINLIANASSYIWTLPSGASGTSTEDSIIVTLSATAVSGNIIVRGYNSCGVGDSSIIAIVVNSVPSAAGSITGLSPVCQGSTNVIYKTTPINGATSYVWTLSSGATGLSLVDSISVNFSNTATSGQVTVKGQNTCGLGTSSSLPIALSPLPGNAGNITAKLNICQGQIDTCSVPAITNIANYIWTLPNGVTGTSTTNKIVVTYGNSAVSGDIIVKGQNSCGFGTSSLKSITVNPLPSKPDTIFGSANACKGQSGFVYNIPTALNASSYIWTLPTGATGSSTTDTILVGYPSGVVSGNITVKGTNACGSGPAKIKAITVYDTLANPGSIIGLSNVCRGQNNLTYTIPLINGATSYVWSLPSGAIGSSSTNTISVSYGTSAISGVITVKGVNNCYESSITSFPVNVGFVPETAGVISGLSTVCNGQNGVVYKVNPINGASSYLWTLSNGLTGSSNVDSILVNINTSLVNATIKVKGVSSCGLGDSSLKSIVINPLPMSAGSITGLSPVCIGSSGNIYKVQPIANATSYIWILPSGAIGTSIADSIILSFPVASVSGNISVKGSNSCGVGSLSSKFIQVNDIPFAAGVISGNPNPCQGLANVNYSIDSISYATSYVWTLPNGVTGTSLTKNITVNYSNTASSGNITVYGTNSCGSGSINTLPITVNPLPNNAGTISGLISVCQGQSAVTYTVPNINNATSYVWTLPLGFTGTSNTNSISLNIATYAISGKIIVKGQNSCGFGDTTSIYVNVNSLPSNAGTISGNALICKGQSGLSYSVPTINNATSYQWTYPSGFTGSSTTNTIVLSAGSNAVTGAITVRGQNSCGLGSQSSKNVTVNSVPVAPSVIIGNTNVCQGSQNQSYSVSSVSGATSYTWSLPFGASGTSTSNNILVGFSSTATSGNIVVKANNACGTSDSTYKLITISLPPTAAATITGPNNVCPGATNQTYTVPAISGATSYVWTLPSGVTGNSTTNSISVNFASSAVAGSISVYGTNSCGDGASSSLAFTINALPGAAGTITSVGGDSIVVAGTKTYTVPAISGATSYVWTFSGTGATITGTTNTVSVAFLSNFTNGTLTVMGQNACGNGTVSPGYLITNYVGIEDQNGNTLSYSIYPNPTKGMITVEINGVSSKLELQITNLQGEVIRTESLSNDKQSYSTDIDLSNYAKGIYFVKIINNNFVKVVKVVLQ